MRTWIGLVLLTMVGCAPGERELGPDEWMTFEMACTRWEEGRTASECYAEQASLRDRCFQACVYTGDCSACGRSWTCRDEPDVCLERVPRFTVARSEDEHVAASCRAYVEHVRGCGTTVEGDPCAQFARVERIDAWTIYDCSAMQECGSESTCPDAPGPTVGLAELVCAALARADRPCDDDLRAWIDGEDGWLRDDVLDQLTTHCFDVPSGPAARANCIVAWLRAISGE